MSHCRSLSPTISHYQLSAAIAVPGIRHNGDRLPTPILTHFAIFCHFAMYSLLTYKVLNVSCLIIIICRWLSAAITHKTITPCDSSTDRKEIKYTIRKPISQIPLLHAHFFSRRLASSLAPKRYKIKHQPTHWTKVQKHERDKLRMCLSIRIRTWMCCKKRTHRTPSVSM